GPVRPWPSSRRTCRSPSRPWSCCSKSRSPSCPCGPRCPWGSVPSACVPSRSLVLPWSFPSCCDVAHVLAADRRCTLPAHLQDGYELQEFAKAHAQLLGRSGELLRRHTKAMLVLREQEAAGLADLRWRDLGHQALAFFGLAFSLRFACRSFSD